MSKRTHDVPEQTPERARNSACFVWYLLDIDGYKFVRENFPLGLEPHPKPGDFENEDLHTYEATCQLVQSLKSTRHEVNDSTQEFKDYERLLWWCEKVLEGEATHPSQEAAQLDDDAKARWVRVRGLKRGIYRCGGRRG